MNLKEAFRYQNKLQSLMEEASFILRNDSNVMKETSTYLRHKVSPEAEDETVISVAPSEYADHINEVVEFSMHLLEAKEKLSAAIRAAKNSLSFDLDGETSLNAKRQETATLLQHMANLRSSEVVVPNGGTGYRFNTDGNQVSYRCDVKKVSTINFDRNKVRQHVKHLTKESDRVSAEIDRCVINTEVDFTPEFNVNDSFADAFEAFAKIQQE